MPWATEDWEGLLEPERAPEQRSSTESARSDGVEHALRSVLTRIPDRNKMKVALAGECDPGRVGFLEAHYGALTVVPSGDEVVSRVRCDLVLVARPSAQEGRLDDLFSRVHRHLREGGICVALLPAATRMGGAIQLKLDGADPDWRRGIHEVELQYRLQKAGFQGARIRRVSDDDGSMLLAMAVRRASN